MKKFLSPFDYLVTRTSLPSNFSIMKSKIVRAVKPGYSRAEPWAGSGFWTLSENSTLSRAKLSNQTYKKMLSRLKKDLKRLYGGGLF